MENKNNTVQESKKEEEKIVKIEVSERRKDFYMLNNSTGIYKTEKAFKNFLTNIKKTEAGKKNIKIVSKKFADKKKELDLKGQKINIAIIYENIETTGYLLLLQTLIKSFKVCELFATSGKVSMFIVKKQS